MDLTILWNCKILAKLPKWFGERPGKKSGDPETPEDEEEAGGEAPGVLISKQLTFLYMELVFWYYLNYY